MKAVLVISLSICLFVRKSHFHIHSIRISQNAVIHIDVDQMPGDPLMAARFPVGTAAAYLHGPEPRLALRTRVQLRQTRHL